MLRSITQMSLREKVGQLLMVGFPGQEVTDHLRKMLVEDQVGGVIFFARNITSPAQSADLIEQLQSLAPIPLIVGVDQEGGTVARLVEGAAVSPGNMALGAATDPRWTEDTAEVMGKELRACGFNMNYAPVVDVNNNPANPVIGLRSFGEDPQKVARLGAAAIAGYQRSVGAAAKHFPGHGDTSVDSHHALPQIAHDLERLEAVELVPFQSAIAANVSAIMTAHIHFPALEVGAGVPATLSYPIITGLLRERMGFDGLVLTDCMEMDAIKQGFGTVEAAVMTIEAGADCVLISHTPQLQREALDAIVAAVESGRISEERLQQSVQRVLTWKEKFATDWTRSALDAVGSAGHQQVMEDAATAAVTSFGPVPQNLMHAEQSYLVLEVRANAQSIAEESIRQDESLGGLLRAAGFTVETRFVSLNPDEQEQQACLLQAEQVAAEQGQIIVLSQDAHRFSGQRQLLSALASLQSLWIVGGRSPYEVPALPANAWYLAAYGMRRANVRGAARVLLGADTPEGICPVTVG